MASIGQRSEMREYERGVIFRLGKLLGTKGPGLVDVKDVVLADSMKRAMAGQDQSERERRAKIINAEGEFQAAEKLVQAASMISTQPIALQLRFLQTMREISSEHHTTTILPVPLDLFVPFIKRSESQTPKES